MTETMEGDDMDIVDTSTHSSLEPAASHVQDQPRTGDDYPNPEISDSEFDPPPPPPTMGKTTEELANALYAPPHAHQISMGDFNRQAHDYTHEAIRHLKASPEYKKHTMRCHSCGSSWYDGQCLRECMECGGYAMHKPCPICHGFCGKMWQRNVVKSHSMTEAHWDGACGHTAAARLLKDMIHMDNITDAMEALGT